jgi:hypothetical protein
MPAREVRRGAGSGGDLRSRPGGGRPPAAELVDLVGWVRDKLERLHRRLAEGYVRHTLHALIRACDPETNPRLRRILEDLDHPASAPER